MASQQKEISKLKKKLTPEAISKRFEAIQISRARKAAKTVFKDVPQMGPEAGQMGPRKWDLTEAQKMNARVLAKEEEKLANRLAKVRAKARRIKRSAEVAAVRAEELETVNIAMLTWLQVFEGRARSLGHQSGITKATNRDGTSDAQLTIRDWVQPYSKKIFDIEDGITDLLPKLPSGVKVRVQLRFRILLGGQKTYAYLPTVMGEQTVYFNYVDPRTVGQLLYKVENRADELVKNAPGLDLAAMTLDIRFEPRWRNHE